MKLILLQDYKTKDTFWVLFYRPKQNIQQMMFEKLNTVVLMKAVVLLEVFQKQKTKFLCDKKAYYMAFCLHVKGLNLHIGKCKIMSSMLNVELRHNV